MPRRAERLGVERHDVHGRPLHEIKESTVVRRGNPHVWRYVKTLENPIIPDRDNHLAIEPINREKERSIVAYRVSPRKHEFFRLNGSGEEVLLPMKRRMIRNKYELLRSKAEVIREAVPLASSVDDSAYSVAQK